MLSSAESHKKTNRNEKKEKIWWIRNRFIANVNLSLNNCLLSQSSLHCKNLYLSLRKAFQVQCFFAHFLTHLLTRNSFMSWWWLFISFLSQISHSRDVHHHHPLLRACSLLRKKIHFSPFTHVSCRRRKQKEAKPIKGSFTLVCKAFHKKRISTSSMKSFCMACYFYLMKNFLSF